MEEKSPLNEEQKRRAASLWYDRFEKKRVSRLNPKQQRYLQLTLLMLALWMVTAGVQMRSKKMDEAMRSEAIDTDPALIFTRELKLEPAEAQVFFPLWETYQRRISECLRDERGLLIKLREVSEEPSPHNDLVGRLGDDLTAIDSLKVVLKRDLLHDVKMSLDRWRSVRLQQLIDEEFSGTSL